MAFALRRPLGATGFSVSPLALASSYGAGWAEVRRAFDSGINMFLWGALRRGDFGRGLSDIARTHRDELVIGVQSYVSHPWLLRPSVEIALRRLRIERLDVFCLAYWDRMPDRSTMDAASALVRDDKIRTLMISSHERRLFPAFASTRSFGALMLRYNAAHPAAETEVFPLLPEPRPAVVAYTATRWGTLLDPRRLPSGVRVPSAADCYRFVLTNPHIDVCLTAPKNDRELSEALSVFDRGPMADDELGWMKRAGAAVRESARRMPGLSSKSLLQHAREMARSIAENGITEDLISRFNR